MQGFKFKVEWAATALTETINAKDLAHAERAIRRRYKTAITYSFLGATLPVPPDRWLERMPRKVF